MNKEIHNKISKTINIIVSILLWLVLWELLALAVGKTFIFPGALETLSVFFPLLIKVNFWKTVLISLSRIILGLFLGIIFGIILAIITIEVPVLEKFISVGMSIIKSTPVASIIMILWVIIGSGGLPIVIALLMVMPIIWQNLIDGFCSIDKQLDEVAKVFNFSKKKRLKILVIPTLLRFFVPAVLTSVGLAWKSGIAAEIISYAKNSIGKHIYDAKAFFEGPEMLAWTLAVVIISIIFEFSVKAIARRFNNKYGS